MIAVLLLAIFNFYLLFILFVQLRINKIKSRAKLILKNINKMNIRIL